MQKAAILLREGATLAKASHLTGYSSEASFQPRFSPVVRSRAGAYRKQLREVVSGAD